MLPYFHFTGGDYLYFRSWHPSSHAAIAGASIALFVLAILERLLHATRGALDARWRRSALTVNTTRPVQSDTPPVKEQVTIEVNTQIEDNGSRRLPCNFRRGRTIPPFVFSRDIARGALYSLQALLSYALMLAVMTFQAAYIISIIVGLGLGEVLFGRLSSAHL